MNSVKDSILLLCNILNKLQSETLLSLHFRSGKDNLNCVKTIPIFWNVIHNLTGVCEDCSDLHKCVKLNLAKRGFRGIHFYTLPADNSCGSRELLLALSWLFANNIIEEKMDKLVSESMNIQEFLEFNVQIPKFEDDTSHYSDADWCKYLLSKAGRLLLMYRLLIDNCVERSNLLKRVHEESQNEIGTTHLLVSEATIMCYRKELLPKYIDFMTVFSSLIEAYQLWKGKEKIYFEWAESVLEKKQNGNNKLIGDNMIENALHFKTILSDEIKNKILNTQDLTSKCPNLGKCEDYKSYVKTLRSLLKSLNLCVIKNN